MGPVDILEGIHGGKVHGKWTGLQNRFLYRNRDLPVYTDFREVFAETLAGLFQFDSREQQFFPGYRHRGKPLKLFKKA